MRTVGSRGNFGLQNLVAPTHRWNLVTIDRGVVASRGANGIPGGRGRNGSESERGGNSDLHGMATNLQLNFWGGISQVIRRSQACLQWGTSVAMERGLIGRRSHGRTARGHGRAEEVDIPRREIHRIGRGPPITLANKRPPLYNIESPNSGLGRGNKNSCPNVNVGLSDLPKDSSLGDCHGSVGEQARTSLSTIDINIPVNHFSGHNLLATTSCIRNTKD